MPAAKPAEFRRKAVELARSGEYPVAKIAGDLGITESCLLRWMKADDVETGRAEGATGDERTELIELGRRNRVLEMEVEILKRASAFFALGEGVPKMRARLVCDLAADGFPVTTSCRVLNLPRATYYDLRHHAPSGRDRSD